MMSDSINEQRPTLQQILGLSDEDMAEAQAKYDERIRAIEESERQAFLAARDVWIR